MASANKGAIKLQEFVAHSTNVNCLALGHKSGHVLVTGGEDKKVNLWAVGKSNCIMSLSGLSCGVSSVRFGGSESQVAAGSHGGSLKVWDLEEARLRRSLPGHKAAITAIDFHPFSSDMLTSASHDTSIKLWDIRSKGCVFTYRGGNGSGSVVGVRFSPDGLWVAGSGSEGAARVWDLRSGRLLKQFPSGGGPLEFHPHEFLLAVSSTNGSLHYWDLEHFTLVSASQPDPILPTCLLFSGGGEWLYAGREDSIRAEAWEPQRTLATLPLIWGPVVDIATSNSTLVGASKSGQSVAVWLMDSKRLMASRPDSPPFTHSNPLRKSFNRQKPAGKEQNKPQMTVKTIEESERSETDPEDEVLPDIPDVDDYRAVFKPNRTLTRSPTSGAVPQSSDEDYSQLSNKAQQCALDTSDEEVVSPREEVCPPPPPRTLEPVARSSSRRNSDSDYPVKLSSMQHSASESSIPRRQTPQPRMCELRILQTEQPPHQKFQAPKSPECKPSEEPPDFIPMSIDRPTGLNLDHFLVESGANEMSESEVLSFMMGDAVMTILEARIRNLNIVYNIWHSKDLKTSVETAVNLRDKSVIVDFLGVITNRPGLWNLDICVLVLPVIHQLLQSKFESHMRAGVDALGLIVRNFSAVIRTNVLSGSSALGVDISREERYSKCITCYNVLVSIRAFLLKRQTVQGTLGQSFRELCASLRTIDA